MEENGKLVQFIFNENKEVITEETDGNITRLIRTSDLWEPEKTWYHYASDEQGSTIFITDAEGNVKNRYIYDAFGNTVEKAEQIPNCYQYTGQQLDPITQQYYLRARFYNPAIARFTQEDEYHGDGLNLYAYCANNPVGDYDQSGYCNSANRKNDVYSNMKGGWMMRREDVEGLNPKQIKEKFALPKEPVFTCDVEIPKGECLRVGIVNPLDGWGRGGGVQFDTIGKKNWSI